MISIEELEKLPYPTKIEAIGLTLLEPFTASNKHHLVQCQSCNHIWNTTLISKISAYKKYQTSGCPECKKKRDEQRNGIKRNAVLEVLAKNHLQVLTEGYEGQYYDVYNKITVKNTVCGHVFDLCISNFMQYGQYTSNCTVCGINQRSKQLSQTSVDRHEEWLKTANAWEQYKSEVDSLTKQTYTQYSGEINPNDFPRGLAGNDGAYQLDHIISRRYCFEHNIPSGLCAHKDNLRMIPWLDNIQKHSRIVTDIPSIFNDYIITDIVVDGYEEV